MDAAKEHEGLLTQILPPRLEDAGLEECALPPESIREAFLKAATAVKSRATSFLTSDGDDETDGNCVEDPWSTAADEHTDVLIGTSPGRDPPAPCTTEKGANLPEFDRDEVVVGAGELDGEESRDKVVVGGMEEGGAKACIDGWQGLKIGEVKKKKKNCGDEGGEDEAEEAEKPILGEGSA